MDKLALTRGSVTPFGLLNNDEKDVKFYIDKAFIDAGLMGIHPNMNDATVFVKTDDVIALVREHGNEVIIYE